MLTMSIGCTAAAMFVNVTMSLNKIVTEANFSVRIWRENIEHLSKVSTRIEAILYVKKIQQNIKIDTEISFRSVLANGSSLQRSM